MTTLGSLLMTVGAGLLVVAMIGVLRLPDTLARQHAATKGATLALGVMALGLGLMTPTTGAWIRLALLIVALWVTLPVASHALARAAVSRQAKLEKRLRSRVGSGDEPAYPHARVTRHDAS